MRPKREKVIKCPNCGCEYLPAEIYLPDTFLGKPRKIDKEHITGKILDYMGSSMNLTETYTCDKCDTEFKVIANINFNTQKAEDSQYKTRFRKEKLFLSEVWLCS